MQERLLRIVQTVSSEGINYGPRVEGVSVQQLPNSDVDQGLRTVKDILGIPPVRRPGMIVMQPEVTQSSRE